MAGCLLTFDEGIELYSKLHTEIARVSAISVLALNFPSRFDVSIYFYSGVDGVVIGI